MSKSGNSALPRHTLVKSSPVKSRSSFASNYPFANATRAERGQDNVVRRREIRCGPSCSSPLSTNHLERRAAANFEIQLLLLAGAGGRRKTTGDAALPSHEYSRISPAAAAGGGDGIRPGVGGGWRVWDAFLPSSFVARVLSCNSKFTTALEAPTVTRGLIQFVQPLIPLRMRIAQPRYEVA